MINTQMSKLPYGIIVGGQLDISYSKIEKLPDKLTIGTDLLLNNNIDKLPSNLKLGGRIYKSIHSTKDIEVNVCNKLYSGYYKDDQFVYCDGKLIFV